MYFGLPILTYTSVNFLRKGAIGTTDECWKWHRAGEKYTANKSELGSAHDRRHIMTSLGYTGISRRDMQTSALMQTNIFLVADRWTT